MRPLLDIRHLELLVAVAEAGSVSRAAEGLGVTQSALSHRLREAERRLGAALFTRINRRLRMTAAGERLHDVAGRLLDELARAEFDVEAMTRGARHVVRIGLGVHTRYQWLPQFIGNLRDTSPDIEAAVSAVANRRPLDMLSDGAIDVAVVAGDVSRPGLRKLPLFEDELVAIVAPRHRLSHKPFIEAEDLVDEVFITYSMEYTPGFEYDRLMLPAMAFPRRSMLVEQPEAIVELVRADFGVSVLTRWLVEPHVEDGTLVALPVTADGLSIEGWAVLREVDGADSPAGRLAEALARWMRSEEG